MSAATSQLLASLSKLSQTELAQAQVRIANLLDASQTDAREDSDLELVHDQLNAVLRAEAGAVRDVPLIVVSKQRHASSFKKGSAVLIIYAQRYFKPKNRADLVGVVRLLLGVLARYIVRQGKYPLTHASLSYKLEKVGAIVDLEFPGYRASGMLPFILKR